MKLLFHTNQYIFVFWGPFIFFFLIFRRKQVLIFNGNDLYETSRLFSLQMKNKFKMSSVAVVIGALKVKIQIQILFKSANGDV